MNTFAATILKRVRSALWLCAIAICGPCAAAQPAQTAVTPRAIDVTLPCTITWAITAREPAGCAFFATQPGPIVAELHTQGAPVVVTLYGANPQPLAQQIGSGTVRLLYNLTPADVQHGSAWTLKIASAQPSGQANGSLAVTHPAADPQAATAAVSALRTTAKQRRQRSTPPPAAASAIVQARRAQFAQEQNARHGALLTAIQSRLPSNLVIPAAPTPVSGLTTRALPPPLSASVAKVPAKPFPRAAPVISSVDKPAGQPDDPLIIYGANFLSWSPQDQVQFLLLGVGSGGGTQGPYPATILGWSDTAIYVTVPEVYGIPVSAGVQITVTRATDGKTAYFNNFVFQPAMDVIELPLPPSQAESFVHNPYPEGYAEDPNVGEAPLASGAFGTQSWNPTGGWGVWEGASGLFGDKGYDRFFWLKRLKYPWTVYSVDVQLEFASNYFTYWDAGSDPNSAPAGADVQASSIGSNSPYFEIHTWSLPLTDLGYWPHVMIIGPRGVPFQ